MRVGMLLLALACAKVSPVADEADGGLSQPQIASVDPQPGPVAADAHFTVRFSSAMDEGQLLAASGGSERVVLAAEADVERAAAAIAHDRVTAEERRLFVPAQASLAADLMAITIAPDQPLAAGKFYLLVSPRLKDSAGRKLPGNGARFEYQVAAPAAKAMLVSPGAGAQAGTNLRTVRATASSGQVALLGPDGGVVAGPAAAARDLALSIAAPLAAGAKYTLALDGAASSDQFFTAAPCARTAPPALQSGQAALSVRDTEVSARVVLDWPARVLLQVSEAGAADPCATGACAQTDAFIACAPPACGPQAFACDGVLRLGGLKPAADYLLRVTVSDDYGFTLVGPQQKFTTVAPLPRVLISEVMSSPGKPVSEAEYVEILNLGPGAAAVDSFALLGPDGKPRPLSAVPPPVPVLLAPGARALAVGSAFDASRYSSIPPGTPVLRASTRRPLGHGLGGKTPPAFQLVLQGSVPVELAAFPGNAPSCPDGASLQRDESVPPDGQAAWSCGPIGGTPGAPP